MFIETAFAQSSKLQSAATQTESGTSELFQTIWGAFPSWIAAITVVFISFAAAKFVKKVIGYRLAKQQYNKEVLILVERSVYVGIVVLGLIIAFNFVGINLTTLFGFLGLGIGLALKDILSNFIAGIMILTQKKVKIGDTVRVNGDIGTIVEIDSRTTQVKSLDGTVLIVPNADMISEVVENYTANSFRRIAFTVGVHYNTPLADVVKLIYESIKKNEFVVPSPVSQVWVKEFADSSINIDVKFWVESTSNRFEIKSQVMQQLKVDFDAAGIQIPFPIRTLALESQDKNLMKAMHLPIKPYPMPAPEAPKKPEVVEGTPS